MTAKTPPTYEPSPEAILAACLEIQGEWTEAERLSRAGFEKRPRAEALKFWLGRFAEIEVG